MKSQIWTVIKVLKWTTEYFSSHEIEQPRTDAEVLLAHLLGYERLDLYLNFDQPLTKKELAAYREMIKRRINHEPVQYILGEQEFWSLPIKVTPAVLIPRPETECLVEVAVEIMKRGMEQDKHLKILEIGTGSGAIALALAKEIDETTVFASDSSIDALLVAKENAININLSHRINFFASDLFSSIRRTPITLFDLIVSNPPYVSRNEFAKLQPEIRKYEPPIALDGGVNGLNVAKRLIVEAEYYLRPMGYLVIEIGKDQRKYLMDIIDSLAWIIKAEIRKDYAGLDRVLVVQKSL